MTTIRKTATVAERNRVCDLVAALVDFLAQIPDVTRDPCLAVAALLAAAGAIADYEHAPPSDVDEMARAWIPWGAAAAAAEAVDRDGQLDA